MNIRWTAVLTGFLADLLLSMPVQLLARPEFFTAPDLSQTSDLVVLALSLLATGVGGDIAGRMGGRDRALHGLLVGVVGVLLGVVQGAGLPRPLVLASAAGCLIGALGGLLSRFPPASEASLPDKE